MLFLSVSSSLSVAWILPETLTSDSKQEEKVDADAELLFENIIVVIVHTVQWPDDDTFSCLIPVGVRYWKSVLYTVAEPDLWPLVDECEVSPSGQLLDILTTHNMYDPPQK